VIGPAGARGSPGRPPSPRPPVAGGQRPSRGRRKTRSAALLGGILVLAWCGVLDRPSRPPHPQAWLWLQIGSVNRRHRGRGGVRYLVGRAMRLLLIIAMAVAGVALCVVAVIRGCVWTSLTMPRAAQRGPGAFPGPIRASDYLTTKQITASLIRRSSANWPCRMSWSTRSIAISP
jgi:hypothetical protein